MKSINVLNNIIYYLLIGCMLFSAGGIGVMALFYNP